MTYTRAKIIFVFLAGMLLSPGGGAQVIGENAQDLAKIRVEEHLGQSIPLDLSFWDEEGRKVALKEFFHSGKPVILNLVYYECPMLCTLVLNGINDVVKDLKATPGQDFQLLSVSINPREKSPLAAEKKISHLEAIGLPTSSSAWRFLVGEEDQIRALADAVGFHYYYDEQIKEYAHPAVTFVLTEDGVISRYLYGVLHEARNVRLALVEAGQGKTGTTFEKFLLYCYRYDPEAKGYVLFARNLMRMGGAFTVLLLGLGFVLIRRKEKMRHKGVIAEEEG